MRGMCSTVLFFEAILFGLATPVMIGVYEIERSYALWAGVGLSVFALLTIGLLGRPFGYIVGHLIQIAAIAMGFLVPAMFVIGGIFAALWGSAYLLGKKIQADRALDSPS